MSNSVGEGYITQDTGHLWGWNGTDWVDVGRIVGPPGPSAASWLNVVNPTLTAFAWINQGPATVTPGSNNIYLLGPAANGDNLRCRNIVPGTAPFSITAGFIAASASLNYWGAGIYVTDGTKFTVIEYTGSAYAALHHPTVSGPGTFVDTQSAAPIACPLFFRIRDDGTNLHFMVSPDGYNFIDWYQEARLSYLSAITGMGFYVNANNTAFPASMNLVSFFTGV
jgi:hypothetical protein